MGSEGMHGRALLELIYIECCNELLGAYGLEASLRHGHGRPGQRSDAPLVCCRQEASTSRLTLASILRVESDLLRRLYPLKERSASHRDVQDWCRELNNQLLGRVKNRLLEFQITLDLLPPVILAGPLAHRSAENRPGRAGEFWYACGAGLMKVELCVEADIGLVLIRAPAAPGAELPMREGELSLF